VETQRVTEQAVMGVDTIHLCEHLLVYPYLDQCYLGKQGEDHRRRRYRCRAFVPGHLLANPRLSAWGLFFAHSPAVLPTPARKNARFSGSSSTTRWRISVVDGPHASLGMSAREGQCATQLIHHPCISTQQGHGPQRG